MAVNMKKEDQDALAAAGAAWTAANAKGDKAGMDAAHAAAEAIRSNYGYSGGADGSQYISTNKNSGGNSQYTGSSVNNGKAPSYAENYKNYEAADLYGVDHQYAKDYPVSSSDLKALQQYGDAYNAAAAAKEQVQNRTDLSEAEKNQLIAQYQAQMDRAHENAEAVRAQYGYSGGVDGSEFFTNMIKLVGLSGQMPSFDYDYTNRPTYDSEYKQRIDELLDQILNRDNFSYNVDEDPLYAMYKDKYEREGDWAMQDTLGQVSARTGGMASSYANTVAQQANQYYAQQLADKVPELYQMAYDMWLDDIDMQVRDLGLLTDMDDTQYGRFRDTMGDWENDRDFAYNMYRDDVSDYKWKTEFDYGMSRDKVSDTRYDKEWAYNVSRDAIEDQRYDTEWAYKVAQDAQAQNNWEAEYTLKNAAKEATNSNSSGSDKYVGKNVSDTGKKVNYDNDGLTSSQVKALQKALGVDQDGYYGPATKKAANGLSAAEAYKKYVGSGYVSNGETNHNGSTGTKTAAMVGMSLGLGPTSASFLSELAAYGGIVEKSDGSMVWSSGWNAGNYKNKLAQAKSYNPFGSILSIL